MFAALLAWQLVMAATARAAVRPATPATFGSVLGQAQPGDVVELAAGNYGSFGGAVKPGLVTVRPQSGAAVTMSVRFSGARNLRVEGMTIPELDISGSTRDVTIANSRFTGGAVIRADQMLNANVVFDGNTHAGIDVCGNCHEGRLQVAGEGPGPSGVTVTNSVFGPGGNADGMQIGADGVQVINNEFVGIRQVSAVHTDSLQLYGQRNTVIRGNYFHDFDVAIMAPDGGTNEVISDNVFVGAGEYRPAVQLGSHRGTQFVHNALRNVDVHMDRKSENPGNPSRDGVIRDNVFVNGTIGGYSTNPSYCSNCMFSHNLYDSSGRSRGTDAIAGLPLFAGGANPSSYAGYVLAPGSPGKGSASDGTDRGIRLQPGAAGAPPAPSGGEPAAGGGQSSRVAGAKLLRLPRRIGLSRLRRAGVRVRISVEQPVKLVLRLSRKSSGRALARKVRKMGPGKRIFVLRPRKGMRVPRKIVLMVRVTNAAGETSVLRRTIRVKKR